MNGDGKLWRVAGDCLRWVGFYSVDFVAGRKKTFSSLGYLVFAVVLYEHFLLFKYGQVGFCLHAVQAESVSYSSFISG